MQNKLHISFACIPYPVKDTELKNRQLILHKYLLGAIAVDSHVEKSL
ncbi:hypothetical protein [Nostoc sp.]